MPPALMLEPLEDRLVPSSASAGPLAFRLPRVSEAGVFRDGTWILDTNNSHSLNAGNTTFVFGQRGDTPVVGDWNGDGRSKVGIFRNVNGVGLFVLDTNGDHVYDAGDAVFTFGLGTDQVVIGDWNGDHRDKVGVYRPDGRGGTVFSLDTNGDQVFDANSTVFTFASETGQVVVGDWNGDSRPKVAFFRDDGRGAGRFVLDYNGNRVFDASDKVFTFGLGSDHALVGDWNADGQAKIGVFRGNAAGQGVWSLDRNNNLAFDAGDSVFTFGLATDLPVTGAWNG